MILFVRLSKSTKWLKTWRLPSCLPTAQLSLHPWLFLHTGSEQARQGGTWPAQPEGRSRFLTDFHYRSLNQPSEMHLNGLSQALIGYSSTFIGNFPQVLLKVA